MSEIIVSIFVAAIVGLIYWRYQSIFSLPFFWAAVFAFSYVGMLQIRALYGGSTYAYSAAAFGLFYGGLFVSDLTSSLHFSLRKRKPRNGSTGRNQLRPASRAPSQPVPTQIELTFPVLPLNVGLFFALSGAVIVTSIFFAENGVPIFASFPAMAWVQATSGIVNRLMTIFGPGCFASLALVAWGIHRKSGSRAALAMMYLGLGFGIVGQALLSTKGAAILIFVWFNIFLFYMNKKRDFRKTVLPLLLVVIPVSAAIVAVRAMSSYGYWQAGGIAQTYYQRLTIRSAEPVDFIFKYMNRFGPMHGGAMRREVARIRNQITGQAKTPTLSEFVYDLMSGESTNKTGLSASLTLFGVGYAEWGIAGMLIYSFIQGLGFGWVHRYLMRQEKMNVFMLIFWGAIVSFLLAVSGSGAILISLESVFLSVIPPLVLLLPFCFLFLLPLARRYRTSAHGKISGIPGGERRCLRG